MKQALRETTLGIQHLLAMYAGAILVPLIVGEAIGLTNEQLTYLVAVDIFMCGVATLLQIMTNRFFGIGLPVVLGCTFTAVGPMIAISGDYGISALYGSIILSGLFIVIISPFFGMLVKFFPPVVTGSVVTIIGLTLIPVAINNMAGGQGSANFGSSTNIMLSFGTLLVIILVYKFTTGFTRSISILIGLVAGTAAAAAMGSVNFGNVRDASMFHMLEPFHLGTPTVVWPAVITMCLVNMVSLVESTGVYFALSDITGKKLEKADLSRGYRAEGIAVMLGGFFNAFPYTTFSQNVGLIQMSGVKSRRIILITAAMLISLGFLPKVAAVTTIIPTSVLGGAMLAMFGMVATQGITMLSRVIGEKPENAMIVACAIGLGLGVSVVPDLFQALPSGVRLLTSNGIVAGSVTAIVLNIVFNMLPGRQEQPAEEPVASAEHAHEV
ncbi:nucleobase:cation symporter-2 family protein [Edaphobacillus lindanitolerans]|uniref:Xanthine permease n=1 Tax=Edaphobacillus lindanitolerans TaxID=550447 RepID=A0A1U7PNY5_9BACI|nr:nucleobase:cation symporter-2 family protein [Edaphobacillus lindanitolerans]SIT80265.1 xanthine permease [Edaphobacillus lindanitolerans]